MACLPDTAHAQAMSAEEAAALRAELASLRAKVETLEARLDAATIQPVPSARSVAAAPALEMAWKGAPEIKAGDGWSFKPRGRVQIDVAGVDTPAGVTGARGGLATEFRRAYLGVDGRIPGGFSYRVEADLGNNAVELTDRSEERSVGKEWVSTCKIRGAPGHTKKKKQT